MEKNKTKQEFKGQLWRRDEQYINSLPYYGIDRQRLKEELYYIELNKERK